MKILIMGLSGSGKTFLSKLLQKELSCAWYNADNLREMANDWDFSNEGRKRQSFRMRALADFEKENGRLVICDFICPTKEAREIFDNMYTTPVVFPMWANLKMVPQGLLALPADTPGLNTMKGDATSLAVLRNWSERWDKRWGTPGWGKQLYPWLYHV